MRVQFLRYSFLSYSGGLYVAHRATLWQIRRKLRRAHRRLQTATRVDCHRKTRKRKPLTETSLGIFLAMQSGVAWIAPCGHGPFGGGACQLPFSHCWPPGCDVAEQVTMPILFASRSRATSTRILGFSLLATRELMAAPTFRPPLVEPSFQK